MSEKPGHPAGTRQSQVHIWDQWVGPPAASANSCSVLGGGANPEREELCRQGGSGEEHSTKLYPPGGILPPRGSISHHLKIQDSGAYSLNLNPASTPWPSARSLTSALQYPHLLSRDDRTYFIRWLWRLSKLTHTRAWHGIQWRLSKCISSLKCQMRTGSSRRD